MAYGHQQQDYAGVPMHNMPPPPPPPGLGPMPVPPPPPPYRFGADSYRPPEQQSMLKDSFSFRNDKSAPTWNRATDSYRPPARDGGQQQRPQQRQRNGDRRERYRDNQQRSGPQNGRPRRPYRFKVLPAERALLTHTDETEPGVTLGLAGDRNRAQKFMAANDVSDSEEEDMADSDQDDSTYEPPESADIANTSLVPEMNGAEHELDGDSGRPAKRQAIEKVPGEGSSTAPAAPKWSNPDPYTVLPPVDEEARKKRDVVKMIRKARIAIEEETQTKTEVSANNDFISFGGDEEEEEDDSSSGGVLIVDQVGRSSARRRGVDQADLDILGTVDSDPAFGNRKRTYDDHIRSHQPRYVRKKPMGDKPTGALLDEWIPSRGSNPIPWVVDVDPSTSAAFRLHREICDYYEYVRPKDFEKAVREDLLDRLQKVIHRWEPTWSLQCFGSFAAGLYLPNADMDVVVMSYGFQRSGRGNIPQNYHKLQKIADFLSQRIAIEDSMEVIASAKVPLIKFADAKTGINVDISFESDNGPRAVRTFERWKAQYPAMPILVVLIKQFLKMRGMSEVVSGGLGGFSVTCMVTSLLQNLPRVQTGEIIPEDNLGEMLIEFLDFYGNRLDLARTGLNMDSPGYFSKDTYFEQSSNYIRGLKAEKARNKLTIIDPNTPSNDISGGSRHSDFIMEKFSEAHTILLRCLRESEERPSLLCWLLGGNYDLFYDQRTHLHRVYTRHWGQSQDRTAPYGIQPINKALSELEIAGTKPPTQVDGSSESEDETQRPDNENVVVRAADEEQLLRELEFATTYVSNVAASSLGTKNSSSYTHRLVQEAKGPQHNASVASHAPLNAIDIANDTIFNVKKPETLVAGRKRSLSPHGAATGKKYKGMPDRRRRNATDQEQATFAANIARAAHFKQEYPGMPNVPNELSLAALFHFFSTRRGRRATSVNQGGESSSEGSEDEVLRKGEFSMQAIRRGLKADGELTARQEEYYRVNQAVKAFEGRRRAKQRRQEQCQESLEDHSAPATQKLSKKQKRRQSTNTNTNTNTKLGSKEQIARLKNYLQRQAQPGAAQGSRKA